MKPARTIQLDFVFYISSNEVHARCNKEKMKVTFLLKQLLHLIIFRKKNLQIVRSWDDDADSFFINSFATYTSEKTQMFSRALM